ncbi:MAG: glucosaminidase domain-containing protein [Bacteroidales bacterium]|nr:glucosaminidase domain-containing protein [Bacteroidales bacterium]
MKRLTTLLLIFLCLILTSSQAPAPDKTPQAIYIDQFATLAVEEMYRSGIPASITLAQGLLESGYGLSELAVKGNNHFGIKCHNNWTGGRMYYDDDKKGECFRKYKSPEESYRDHSDFLRYRDRYKFLFDYKITDYKSWAHGLKKAGYATDPSYPTKLINLIETYGLHEYDKKPASFAKSDRKSSKKAEKNAEKENRKSEEELKMQEQQLPPTPTEIEQVKPLTDSQRQEFHFSLSRQMYSQNGVPFVYSVEGETYQSIAASNNLFEREILKFNEASKDDQLLPGTVVYLKPKKNQAAKGLDKHVFEEGDSMRELSQRFGVRLDKLYKMNGMPEGHTPKEGDIIRLRK